jgi:hypothetical protein
MEAVVEREEVFAIEAFTAETDAVTVGLSAPYVEDTAGVEVAEGFCATES